MTHKEGSQLIILDSTKLGEKYDGGGMGGGVVFGLAIGVRKCERG